ncbi:uncharacterized protein M6B38_363630 [Iris pallida]|uniref:Uncharacterized protein n=1 Tax=Iris pallida TaxID=29817 RepID=A0AAX6GI99_IRIPA|nr:uncharacterized protein M6B38_363630 [Iris pallida]
MTLLGSQMPRHLIRTRMNGLTRFPLSLSTIQRNHSQGNGLGRNQGERRPG